MVEFFALLLVFQLKHFLCDYPLQGRYMLGKFKAEGWFLPLFAHGSVHAVGTFIIAALWKVWAGFPYAWSTIIGLAILDCAVHTAIDRLKASPSFGGRWNMSTPQFWWALGADQMAHHLTHYGIIWLLIGG